jgi:hypothetical protein
MYKKHGGESMRDLTQYCCNIMLWESDAILYSVHITTRLNRCRETCLFLELARSPPPLHLPLPPGDGRLDKLHPAL